MRLAAILFILSVLTACAQQAQPIEPKQLPPLTGEKPSGTTSANGHTIAYQLYPNPGKPGIILLHMLGRTRHDWKPLAEQLTNYAVIAIDFRGHGQSSGNWQAFDTSDFAAMTNDVAAAKSVLKAHNADTSTLVLIGASIGANIAYNYAQQDDDVTGLVLLSPGEEYRGITVQPTTSLPHLIVASNDDTYSAESSKNFAQNINSDFKLYDTAGHGTNMLSQPDLVPLIRQWLDENIQT